MSLAEVCNGCTCFGNWGESSWKCIERVEIAATAACLLASSAGKDAEIACSRIKDASERKSCIFDVLATEDLDIALSY